MLLVPNIIATAAGGLVDWRAPGVLAILGSALVVKEAHLPEALLPSRKGLFDHSPLHSHVLWHLLVWGLQALYLCVFRTALAEAATEELDSSNFH